MKMSPADIKKYPRFHQYVSVAMPEVQNVSTIINAIKKLAGKTPTATIKEALQWNKGPTIEIVKDLKVGGKRVNGAYSWGSDIIKVDLDRVTSFESKKNHLGKNKKGQQVYLVGVTLLHELTHWADAQDGVDDAPYEEGDQFELDVYGKFVR